MNTHECRAASDRAGQGAADPIPASMADSLWLGGEAMVAPQMPFDLPDLQRLLRDEEPDPTWLAI